MKPRIVIDSSVFLTYCSHGKIYRLSNAADLYNLEIFVNDHLINELLQNLEKVAKKRIINAIEEINFIVTFVNVVQIIPIFNKSPDPKVIFFST